MRSRSNYDRYLSLGGMGVQEYHEHLFIFI